jgi:GT2 family glycosyltransferase
MISIIISSYQKKYLSAVKKNIAETIGVEYEIIEIDNPGKMGICEAYNTGAKKSRYLYLCFVHEDVRFITINWGQNLINHFSSDPKCGVFGLAGSVCKNRMLTSWWQPVIEGTETKRTNYIQTFSNGTSEHFLLNPLNEHKSLVVSLDGVFMAMKKDVWEKVLFDEKLLKGFHAYDLDFTIRSSKNFNNYVVYDILLEHYSEGVNDLNWLKQNLLIHNKNKGRLPIIKCNSIYKEQLRKIDQFFLEGNIELLAKEKENKKEAIKIFLQLIGSSGLYVPNIPLLKKFLKTVIFN